MTVLTIGERIILHLGRYDMIDPDEIYNTPWDLTQDGIASSLRISRAHASIELKKLREADKVAEKNAHIKGGRSKRKAYFLTTLGLSEASRIKDYVEEEGIDFTPLLDMKRCDPNTLMGSFDEESRNVLGLACVFRCSVKREALPETKQSVVPVDVSGRIIVSDDVKKKVLSVIDGDQLKELHSRAADHWLTSDEPDRQERLYHLVRAGRTRDACKLLIHEMDDLMDDPNEDLRDILNDLQIPEKYHLGVLPMKITILLEFGDIASAKKTAEQLSRVDKEIGTLLFIDIELASGNADNALAMIEGMKDHSDTIGYGIRKAKCLHSLSRSSEALELLESTKNEINRTGDLKHLNDVYLLIGDILIETGRPSEAGVKLGKALSGARGPREKKRIQQKMDEARRAG